MKKTNLACAHLRVARITGKFGAINLTRLQAKFDKNLKFESKFCGADGYFKFNPNLPNLLKFDEAASKFNQSANKKRAKPSQNKASAFSTASRTEPSNFKLQNPKERKNK
ncbi:hypothetical protein [Campylobacter showae]|uniref:Uncharacterized protein n=1 Tax=Campylobacter showae CC57C TaxID=1073353 RepID=M3JDD7_9BACT|nr:hypothetical protein [Campylobacter showae]EMG31348.1 hypothetical protein H740_01762 [Campylobacter showae CC57C]